MLTKKLPKREWTRLDNAAGIATKTVHNIENGVYQVTNGTYSKIKNFFLSPEVVNNLVKSGWMFNTSSDDVIDFIMITITACASIPNV